MAVKLARRGSVKKQLLRASLFSSLPSATVVKLLGGDVPDGNTDVLSDTSSEECDEEERARAEHVLNLCSDSESTDGEPLQGEDDDDLARRPSTHWSSNIARMQKAGHDDWMILLKNGFLTTSKYSRRRFHESVIHHLVRFIFRPDNAQLMSWCTVRLKLKGVYHRFPVVRRKGTIEILYEKYNLELGLRSGVARVGRTVFIQIASKLTCGQVKERESIDYYQHALVFENMNNVMSMVENECRSISSESLSELKRKCEGMINFLKYMYTSHLSLEHDDPFHSIDFALYGDPEEEKRVQCQHCCSPSRFISEVRDVMSTDDAHFNEVLGDAEQRLELYVGHKLRDHVQDLRLQGIMEGLKKSKPAT